MSQKIPETDYFSNAERDSLEEITALHRGAFCQSSFHTVQNGRVILDKLPSTFDT